MDIKMIKELCEEHEALTKTNESLGKIIDSCKDNYILFHKDGSKNYQTLPDGKIIVPFIGSIHF